MRFSVCLWCPPRCHESHRVLLPNALQILLKLLLASAHPRRVVALSNPHALVSEENRNPFERDASEEQLNRNCVPESMCVSALNFCQCKDCLQPPLPLTDGAMELRLSPPKEMPLARAIALQLDINRQLGSMLCRISFNARFGGCLHLHQNRVINRGANGAFFCIHVSACPRLSLRTLPILQGHIAHDQIDPF